MKGPNILRDLENGKAEVDAIAEKAREDTALILTLIEGVGSQKARIRFGSAKVLRRLSEMGPKLLYPYWDHFADRLSGENTFLRSDAMFVIANLALVDSGKKFERIFEKFYSQLNDKSMIPAANAAGNSGKIALAKPHLQTKIINRLIRIDETDHGSECRNIIKGGVIDSFEEFYEDASKANKRKMLAFVRRETRNRRKSTRRKAARFVSRHGRTE